MKQNGPRAFARGPDATDVINVPNNTSNGIPIALSNGNGVTDADALVVEATLRLIPNRDGKNGDFQELHGGIASLAVNCRGRLVGFDKHGPLHPPSGNANQPFDEWVNSIDD